MRFANASITLRTQSEIIAMTLRLLFIIIASLLWTFFKTDAQAQTLEINFSYQVPQIQDVILTVSDTSNTLLPSQPTCDLNSLIASSSDPTNFTITCDVTIADETMSYNYQLKIVDGDGNTSPTSPVYPFAITTGVGDTTPPVTTQPPASTGNHLVNYSWEASTDSLITGYRMYMNDTPLCETADTLATTLSCYANLVNTTMNFSIVSYDASGIESAKSNFLTLDPADFPELFQKKTTTFSWEYADAASSAGGFQVFSNNELLCQTTDPAARTLTCTIDILQPEHTFLLAAVSSTGELTTFSNSIVYTSVSGSTEPPTTIEPLTAVITTPTTSGPTPLAVSFSATTSTGDIASYSWDFGDGDKATGATVSHTYAIAGTYSATLAVTDSTGNSALTTTSITAEKAISQPIPPTAAISSSAAAGEAPLSVTFDGSASTTTNSTIVSYDWDFGDGSKGTDKTTTHTFSIAGTYNTELLVTDSLGLTDTETTPVIVIAATVVNQKPSASFTATPPLGSSPLTVAFDASASQDSDGTIANYIWNFGDGSAGSGKTVQHTYTTAATFTATLQVTDNQGATSDSVAKTIVAEEAKTEIKLNYEIGELALTTDWVRVNFENTFTNPAVFISPPTNNEKEAVITRVRNLNKTGFDIRLQEWDYLDDKHAQETVSFLALEQGQTILADGSIIEVGSFNGSTRKETMNFKQKFSTAPVVLTTVISENEKDAVIGRVSAVTTTSFTYLMQEQESTKSKHVNESVVYMAWTQGSGDVDNIHFSAAIPATTVTSSLTTILFNETFQTVPFLFSEQQTMNSADTAAIRIQQVGIDNVELFLQEEQSKDSEVSHAAETIGYLRITTNDGYPAATLDKRITFTWKFDTNKEPAIQGFRIKNNDQLICESTNPSDRQITCETTISINNRFTIVAVDLSGEETSASNDILYNQ